MSRNAHLWRTRFGRWIRCYTVRALVEEFDRAGHPITRKAVYSWVSGATIPRPSAAKRIILMSQGRLSWDDLYGQLDDRANGKPARS